jgi:hypothetical protein
MMMIIDRKTKKWQQWKLKIFDFVFCYYIICGYWNIYYIWLVSFELASEPSKTKTVILFVVKSKFCKRYSSHRIFQKFFFPWDGILVKNFSPHGMGLSHPTWSPDSYNQKQLSYSSNSFDRAWCLTIFIIINSPYTIRRISYQRIRVFLSRIRLSTGSK